MTREQSHRIAFGLCVSALILAVIDWLIWSRTIDMGDLTGPLTGVMLLAIVVDIGMAAYFFFRPQH